jgi:hypothetical protein
MTMPASSALLFRQIEHMALIRASSTSRKVCHYSNQAPAGSRGNLTTGRWRLRRFSSDSTQERKAERGCTPGTTKKKVMVSVVPALGCRTGMAKLQASHKQPNVLTHSVIDHAILLDQALSAAISAAHGGRRHEWPRSPCGTHHMSCTCQDAAVQGDEPLEIH